MSERTINVNADALARLLKEFDSGGFLSNELGVAWIDGDESGVASHLVGLDCPFCVGHKRQEDEALAGGA